jgi:hypothetical protein
MTESEWMAATDPEPMLEFLRGKAGSREFRLFAVACCRRIWRLITSEASRHAVEVGERLADGLVTESERREAHDAANLSCIYVDGDSSVRDRLEGFAAEAALCAVFGDHDYPPIPTYSTACAIAAARAAQEAVGAQAEQAARADLADSAFLDAHVKESAAQCDIARRIFGNSFREHGVLPPRGV